ncbi:nucleotidyltransferase domain-containing protein [Candidatus Woesearchaeota archaeon]|nr:nucleotidyltransferase domain-containing protein [Candidatus Woesearchaeota archaeon]
MAKKEYAKKEYKKEEHSVSKDAKAPSKESDDKKAKDQKKAEEEEMIKKLPPEVQEKLKEIKGRLEKFQTEVLKKFEHYIMGIALMPPSKQGEKVDKDKINVLVLVDDSDSQRMTKQELKDKLGAIMEKMAQDIDKRLTPQTVILSDVWQSCYDGKFDLLQLFAMCAPVHDTGMMSALKIGEIHKEMVMKKFEKYIVSYVLFGSLTRGQATSKSDIDVAIIVDDTDVKKMTRAELKDKLRAIIIGMGLDAGDMTGIKNKLNIQVYILTDFWESIKEANPVIFTVLRDGVPLYDRGIFMPWKQLLKMGKIKPSAEAIDMFMASGEQMVSRVKTRLKQVVETEIYWSTLTPTQAALMLYGIPPPTPKETVNLAEEIFVKKEKLLEEKYIETLRDIRKYYKGIEHGEIKDVTGKEIDDLLDKADKYLKRLSRLFTQIEKMKEEESMLQVYETVVTIIRDVLILEGIERVKDIEVIRHFETELVHRGKIPEKYLRMLDHVVKAKKDYDEKRLTKADIENVKKESRELVKFLVEYMQRKRGRELERARIRVKHGDRYGEILLLEDMAFIIHDVDNEDREVTKAPINKDGTLGQITGSSMEELEEHLAKYSIPPKVFIKEPVFEKMKEIFGKDVEILVNY